MLQKIIVFALMALLAVSTVGCSGRDAQSASSITANATGSGSEIEPSSAASSEAESEPEVSANNGESSSQTPVATAAQTDLIVRFGDDGDPFSMHLYDNPTAAAIATHVGTADWRLPIYSFDDYENWEVMQFYDIPSRYEIPSAPEAVTAEKAGEVYYSHPNRIVLFYGDAQVSGEYTRVGYFDLTETFVAAVQNNPVLEGWGNKIVNISDGE